MGNFDSNISNRLVEWICYYRGEARSTALVLGGLFGVRMDLLTPEALPGVLLRTGVCPWTTSFGTQRHYANLNGRR